MKLIRVPGTLRFVWEKNLWSQHQVAMAGGNNPKTGLTEYYPTRIGKFTNPFQYKLRGSPGDRDSKNYWMRGTNPNGKVVTIPPNTEYLIRIDPYTGTR